jgi:hypothetical protein
MLESQASEMSTQNELRQLVQSENLIGACYRMTYDQALVMANDMHKAKVRGVPHNCFLVAASFNPDEFPQAPADEKRVILLRVTGSAKLPQDDDLIEAKIQNLQERSSPQDDNELDDITESKMQFHGLECAILGTFYQRDQKLKLGSDIESFASASRLNVYRPRGEALGKIVNFVDPIKQEAANEAAEEMGLEDLSPFKVGTVRYTSTDHMHREEDEPKVPVEVEPADFLGRRTAVLGMTRTGKSNMIKRLVSVVKRVSDENDTDIGQIIYDVNGEYANVNEQDEGSLADIYPNDDVVRYSTRPRSENVEDLRANFYDQLNEGHSIIARELEKEGQLTSDYKKDFASLSFDEPPEQNYSKHTRWERRVAAYQAILYRAGFDAPENYTVSFPGPSSDDMERQISEYLDDQTPVDPRGGLTLQQAADWFTALKEADNETEHEFESSSGNPWIDGALDILLQVLTGPHLGSYQTGYRMLTGIDYYHSSRRSGDVPGEIYSHLEDGRIVILDLSLMEPSMREERGERVAREIFNKSMGKFVHGERPPNIVVYTEESHNLIGNDLDLDETWPRLAKEGAKYNIAMVYATQEVSSVHDNILSNTENWFITHLNNENEIRELSKFYDFDDFSKSLLRAQDVGFARVKTLSGPFVIPTQIDEFDPDQERQRVQQLAEHSEVDVTPETDGQVDGENDAVASISDETE